MKYLIIPDVHNRWETVEKIIKHATESFGVDKIIFLGDHFDDFNDDCHVIADVADWFHWSINQPNRIHIAGNHDIHYWFTENRQDRCAGYDQSKSIVINDFVKQEDWRKLVFYYNLDNKWLLSHGGLHPAWVNPTTYRENPVEFNIKDADRILGVQSREFLKAMGRKQWHWFGMPGRARCKGSPYYGGLLWCDWEQEFWPIRGLNQIVGHTPKNALNWVFLEEGDPRTHRAPLGVVPKLSEKTSYNICLDSIPGSRFYAIYDGETLNIHETAIAYKDKTVWSPSK